MTESDATWRRLLPLLVCLDCRRSLSILASFGEGDAVLGHASGECHEKYPVIDGVPRLLTGEARGRLYRDLREWFADERASRWFTDWAPVQKAESLGGIVVSRFDREWASFGDVDTAEQSEIFKQYFDLVPEALASTGSVVLDAGCGAGRWAIQIASRGGRVVALDAGRSVELASLNGRPWRIECVQADVAQLPFAAQTFDFVCSLGVLHHVEATEKAAAELVRVLRPGGHCLIYLYYALDNRGPIYRGIHGAVSLLRRALARSPHWVVGPISAAIAAVVYLPLARTSRLVRRMGLRSLAAGLPLAYYADRSFRVMRNDSVDRFGTRLEKRFTRGEVAQIMMRAGLEDVRISEAMPRWHALGRRPSGVGAEP